LLFTRFFCIKIHAKKRLEEEFVVAFQKIILFETTRNKVGLLQNKNPLRKQGICLEMLLSV